MSGRAERPLKKVRRVSTDSEGTEGGLDLIGLHGTASTPTKKGPQRSRRAAPNNKATATVSRGPAPPLSTSPQSMRLTVKTSANKLREATRSSAGSSSKGTSAAMKDPFIGGQILEGKRARGVKKSYVMESESEEDDVEMQDDDEEEDEEEEEEDEDEDAEGELDEDAEDDGLGDEDAEGDIDMDLPAPPPPPPVIKISKAQNGRQSIVVKPPSKADPRAAAQQENGSEDEDLSDLSSPLGEDAEEEGMQTGNEEDAEGEDEDAEGEEIEEDEEMMDSDDETPEGGSRAWTPDLSKLTKRQRARLEEGGSGHLLALPDEVQIKKHFTAEEHAMRRAEMARRRKNLSEKRNEEEKMETINKLLKKQAPKTNARRRDFNNIAGEATPDTESVKPDPGFVRWVSTKQNFRIGVPEEWLEAPVGSIFENSVKRGSSGEMGGKMVQEVS